jgi:hypothetical protein
LQDLTRRLPGQSSSGVMARPPLAYRCGGSTGISNIGPKIQQIRK